MSYTTHPTTCSYCLRDHVWTGKKAEYLEPGARIHSYCLSEKCQLVSENKQNRNRECAVCRSYTYTYIASDGFTVTHEYLGRDDSVHERCAARAPPPVASKNSRECAACRSHTYTYVASDGFTVTHEYLGQDDLVHRRCAARKSPPAALL